MNERFDSKMKVIEMLEFMSQTSVRVFDDHISTLGQL